MSSSRPKRRQKSIWLSYRNGNKLKDLVAETDYSKNTLRTQLQRYTVSSIVHHPTPLTVIIDVTYFGRSCGVVVAIDAHDGSLVYSAALNQSERTVDYEMAFDTIESLGYTIQAVVIDGRPGVRSAALERGILVQHCHFHQLQTVTQCLTKHPVLQVNRELRSIALTLTRTSQVVFEQDLKAWHNRHAIWLSERYHDTAGRLRYSHPRTRRAYFSLKRNMDYLFTYRLHPEAIPNTTNKLDGVFGVIKPAIKVHRGAKKELKVKLLISFLSDRTD